MPECVSGEKVLRRGFDMFHVASSVVFRAEQECLKPIGSESPAIITN